MKTRSSRKRGGCAGCATSGIISLIIASVSVYVIYLGANRNVSIPIPSPHRPTINAYDDFVRVGTMFTKMKHKSPASMPGDWRVNETYENYAACAKDAQAGLTLLRLALNRECLAPTTRSFKDRHWRDHAKLLETARTISGAAGYFERISQFHQAVDLLLDGYEMAVMIPRGAPLNGSLVGHNCESIVLMGLEPFLPRLSSSDLDHAAVRLERIHAKQVAYADIIQEQGWSSTAAWKEILLDPKGPQPSFDYPERTAFVMGKDRANLTFHDRLDLTKFMFANKSGLLRENLDYFEALSKEVRTTPYSGISLTPMPKNMMMEMAPQDLGGGLRGRHESMNAVNDLLRLEVALMRYRKANKAYPASLKLLTPKYLPSVPVDPFSGPGKLPYRYSVENGGKDFLLYSLGPDLKDDGGAPTRFPGDGNPGDIVAGKMWRQSAGSK